MHGSQVDIASEIFTNVRGKIMLECSDIRPNSMNYRHINRAEFYE